MNLNRPKIKETYLALILFALGFTMHTLGPDQALDTRFYYTAAQANDFLRGLGKTQARAYLTTEILDLFFLTAYSLLFYLLARRFSFRKTWLAFIPGFFDGVETITIIFLLLNQTWNVPVGLGMVTSIKWTTGFLIGFLIFVRALQQWRRRLRFPRA